MNLPATLRLKRQAVRWSRTLRRSLRGTGTTYVGERVGQYREYWSGAAARLGAEFVDLTDRVWEVRLEGRSTRITNYIVQMDDTVTNTLAGDKPYGYRQAEAAHVPAPTYGVFDLSRLDEARRFAATVEGPVVLKPARGSASAIGITTHIESEKKLSRAACLASLFCDDWIVESMHFGESCRLLMLDGDLLHAVRRKGLRVNGDGRRTLRELLPPALSADATVLGTLAARGLGLDHVAREGEEVLVRSLPATTHGSRELRTEYDEEITDRVHPDLISAARSIAERFGSRFAGVDFVTPDPTRPLTSCGGVFLELNTTPGIHHHDTAGDRPLPVAVRVLSRLLSVSSGSHASASAEPVRHKETP